MVGLCLRISGCGGNEDALASSALKPGLPPLVAVSGVVLGGNEKEASATAVLGFGDSSKDSEIRIENSKSRRRHENQRRPPAIVRKPVVNPEGARDGTLHHTDDQSRQGIHLE